MVLLSLLLVAPTAPGVARNQRDTGHSLLPAGEIEDHPTVQALRAENSELKVNVHKLESWLLEAQSRGAEYATHPGQMWPHVTSLNASTAFSKAVSPSPMRSAKSAAQSDPSVLSRR